MKRLIWLLLLACGALHAAETPSAPSRSPDNPDLPASIVELIPAGYEELDHLAGHLSGTNRLDYLVVIHRAVDTMGQPSPRPLLIFTQDPAGTFRLAARNDAVILRANDGGQCDPFTDSADDGLAIKGRYFTVQHGVACGLLQHWTDYVTFRYDKDRRDWLFHSQIAQNWRPNDGPTGGVFKPDPARITKANKDRPVAFEAWRPNGWCIHPWREEHENDSACSAAQSQVGANARQPQPKKTP
ncbi:hypothetical protein [Variovorax sp. GB1P17]|uniref:hypothetical protein n=1 Tax=Variovorax sp. GB1P17 TaxID=3443740 RepID=UPI003F446496